MRHMTMNKSLTAGNNCTQHAIQLIAVLFFSILLTACDGGIFGTGDSSNDLAEIDAGDAISNGDMQPTDGGVGAGATEDTDSATDTSDESTDTGASDEADTAEPAQTPVTDFSNTTPSGITGPTALLPALKVINLSNLSLLATATDTAETVLAPVAQTSEFLSLNTGETTVNITNNDNGAMLAVLGPLNAVADSITTLVITDNTSDNNTATINLDAFDTRAVVSATAMAEVRLIAVPGSDATLAGSLRLTPDDTNADGVELVLSLNGGNDQTSIAYSLANPGAYTLNDFQGALAQQQIELQADTIYTLILSDNPQMPVYIEIDSLTP